MDRSNRLLYPRTKIDWGPGENHICLRTSTKNYYVIELFHQSPTLDKLIPLFINDINSSPNLFQIYYQIAENLTQIVLINNYPVNKVRIVGKIINEKYKSNDNYNTSTNTRAKSGNGQGINDVFLTIDDFVGSSSRIIVNLNQSKFRSQGCKLNMSNRGKIVEIEGIINNKYIYYNRYNNYNNYNNDNLLQREIDVEKFTVLSHNGNEFHIEMENWKKTLEFRNLNLLEPWVFIPSPQRNKDCQQQPLTYRFTEAELRKRNNRQNLVISSPSPINEIQPEELAFEDSLLVDAVRKSSDKTVVDSIDNDDWPQESGFEELKDDSAVVQQQQQQQQQPNLPQIPRSSLTSRQATPLTSDTAINGTSLGLFNQLENISNKKDVTLKMDDDDNHDDDDDIIILAVNDNPVKVVTEFQVTLEIIKFIINKNFTKFKLVEIYRHNYISQLLTNLTTIQLSTLQQIPNFKNLTSFDEYKSIIFHRIRRVLQFDYELITVSQTQLVKLKNLQNLFYSLIQILHNLSDTEKQLNHELNVMDYIELLRQEKLIFGGINYKIINGIIDYILTMVLKQDRLWKYDTKNISWKYIG